VIETTDVERFRSAISARLGLQFDASKDEMLAEVLARRAAATGCAAHAYALDIDEAECTALAGELTVGETYFFRNIEQFHAFSETVVPERTKARAAERQLRVLSAGCSSGEEAYTLAILLRELLPPDWDAVVRAVDVNRAALERARRARYSRWSLRETPETMQQRWFTPQSRDFVLDESIRAAVTFEARNLVSDQTDLWQPGAYDAIFCRNVLMYFSPDRARALVERIAGALAPDGYLFLGHAETLRGVSQAFDLCHTHGTFYYRRRAGRRADARASRPVAAPVPPRTPGTELDPADSWVDAIQLATERVARLAAAVPPRGTRSRPVAPGPVAFDLDAARELLRQERFVDALDLVDSLPAGADRDPDVLILRSVVLTHAGRLDRAEESCRRLLEIDDLNAGAHYVLALCREGSGDLAGATRHDQMAGYLDPAFAMPRLHLGLLARRAGDAATARRELAHAASLLEREDASRLFLFGGGFGRGALIALCRADAAVGEAVR